MSKSHLLTIVSVIKKVAAVKKTTATFTVNALRHATLVYQRATNHDLDNGTIGSAITVAKP